ncbi:MAG: hypothetical protein WA817_18415 [Candidatus Acidiferrum sp.]
MDPGSAPSLLRAFTLALPERIRSGVVQEFFFSWVVQGHSHEIRKFPNGSLSLNGTEFVPSCYDFNSLTDPFLPLITKPEEYFSLESTF